MISKHPPLLMRSPFSGKVYIVTRWVDRGEGRIEAVEKFDVTDQFDALVAEKEGKR